MTRQGYRAEFSDSAQCLAGGKALGLGSAGGDLTLLEGAVWLTYSHDLRDYFVEPPAHIRLPTGERAVIEAVVKNQDVAFRWHPRRQGVAIKLLSGYLRGAAFFSSAAASGFTAIARGAAASANRLQGVVETRDIKLGEYPGS